jgi:hypothetical protein
VGGAGAAQLRAIQKWRSVDFVGLPGNGEMAMAVAKIMWEFAV